MTKRKFGLTTVVMAGLLGGCMGAAASMLGVAHAGDTAAKQSVTVFVDATFGFRKNHMANQLTKKHAEFAAKGYDFASMAPYTENGDLQGFFVTYTRD